MFSPSSVLFGPLVAVAALGLILLLCRWVFSTDTRDQRTARRRQASPAPRDYGLLVPIATVRAPEDAELLRQVLAAAGIRATVAREGGSRLTLLVFRDDAARARDLVVSR